MKTSALIKATVCYAAVLLLTGCIFDSLINLEEDLSATGRTITIEVAVPDENPQDAPQTRLSLEEDGLNIIMAWEAGDNIYLVFTQEGAIKGKQTVTLTTGNISNEGKKAVFSLVIPEAITEGTFNLYGVCGGEGFAGEESYELYLPELPWSGTLAQVQNKKVSLLRFAVDNINIANPSVSAVFEHVGSLFHIAFKNSGSNTLMDITKAELTAATAIQAYQNIGSATYNPVTGEFYGVTTAGTSLPFVFTSTDLPMNGILHFWGWHAPVANQIWPALSLQITADGGPYTSTNARPARITATACGKAYHFYAVINDATLKFIDTDSEGYIIDTRDNNIYKTVTIDSQTWMAENLKFLPSVSNHYEGSDSSPYYYVYDYQDGDVTEAKTKTNYQIYGVLYNWPAAMAGASSSDTNPSGIQGACPAGWHLPSDAEWTQLTNFLGVVSIAGGKMKETGTTHWKYPNEGATNERGFTALPGGYRSAYYYFYYIGEYGFWWSATQGDYNSVYRRYLGYNYSDIGRNIDNKDDGYSVRCVKD
jgi:uncharacterized protein (TIGR02145 family)